MMNFFKLTFRNLWKTKGYSFLNIFGLALGITVTSLIFLWINDERTYNDNFRLKKDIYITKSKQSYDGNTYVFQATPGPFAAAIQEEIPGLKKTARMSWGEQALTTVEDKNLYQFGYYADPEILDILTPEFIAGDKANALKQPGSIILSESAAKRIFGTEQALGKTLKFDNDDLYSVTGITKDFPKNSSFNYDWLIDFRVFENKDESGSIKSWGNNSIQTLALVEPGADIEAINEKLRFFAAEKMNSESRHTENFLYPMERWRMYNVFKDGIEQDGGIKNVRLFSSIAWLILLIACINFMNLATARSEKRAKEVSMRKIVGAKKSALIAQFLGESLVYAFLAGLLAILLVRLSLPFFNTLINKDLHINLFDPQQSLFLLAIVLICGAVAGSYPAFFLSSFDPLSSIKGNSSRLGSSGLIRKALVIIQYTAAVILIICTSVIYLQIRHTKNRDLGFDRSHVINTQIQGDMLEHIEVIKQELLETGLVDAVSRSGDNVLSVGSNTSGFQWDGKDPNSSVLIGLNFTDADYLKTLDMQLASGRDFRPQFLGDSTSIIVNETLAKTIQADGQVSGKLIRFGDQEMSIIGVVKDYVYNNIYGNPDPLILIPISAAPWGGNGILNIKTKAGVDFSPVIEQLETIVKKYNPNYPFSYTFLDDSFNQYFQSELTLQKLGGLFAALAIIISSLGLFGLAAYAAERRAREVSIRKVLGASVGKLVTMLNLEFLLLIGISCLIAFPIAWWYMKDWLKDYLYRIDMPWEVYLFTAVVALVIALLTISGQALKAAKSNPTKILRNE